MPDHPIAKGLHLLTEVLEREKEQGREFVDFAPDSQEKLESLSAVLLSASMRKPAATVSEKKPPPSTPAPVSESAEAKSVSETPASKPDLSPSAPQGEKAVRAELNRIFKEVKSCERLRELGTLRETIVFAAGNPIADIMFVGEAPGAEEENQKKPFVGPAGEKLNGVLKAMGLSREEIYISNIVKYRPKKADGRFQGTSNRKPDPTEMEISLPFLRREIAAVAPRVIVALGATAAEGLLQRGGPLSEMRGQNHDFEGIPVVVTYHPSFLLRQEREGDPAKAKEMKRRVWSDMLRVMEVAGLTITDRQRNFFK